MRDQIVAHVARDAPPALAAEARALVKKKGNIADQLVAAGFAPGKVLEACCSVTGIPPAALSWLRDPRGPPPGVDVDAALCRQLGCAPVAKQGGKLCIAYADPEIAAGSDTLGFPEHAPYLALRSQLEKAFALLPPDDDPAFLGEPTGAMSLPRLDQIDDATAAIDPIEAAAAARASMRIRDDNARGGDDDELGDAPTIKQARPPEVKPPKARTNANIEASSSRPRANANVEASSSRPRANVEASTSKPRPKAKTEPRARAPVEMPVEPPVEAPVEMPLEELLVAPAILPVAVSSSSSNGRGSIMPAGQETPATSEAPWGTFQAAHPEADDDAIKPRVEARPPPPPRVPTKSVAMAPTPPSPSMGPSMGRGDVALDESRPFAKKPMMVSSFKDVESSLPAKRPTESSLPARRPGSATSGGLDPFVGRPPGSASSGPMPAASGASSGGGASSSAAAAGLPFAPGASKKQATKPAMQTPFIPGIDDVPATSSSSSPAAALDVGESSGKSKKAKKTWNEVIAKDEGGFVAQLKVAKTQLFAAGAVVLIIAAVAFLSHGSDSNGGPVPGVAPPSAREGEGKLDLTARQLELVARGKSEKDDEIARKLFSQAIAMNPNAPGARDAFLERARRSIAVGDAVQADLDISVLRRRGDVDAIMADINGLISQLGELKAHPRPRVAPAKPGTNVGANAKAPGASTSTSAVGARAASTAPVPAATKPGAP